MVAPASLHDGRADEPYRPNAGCSAPLDAAGTFRERDAVTAATRVRKETEMLGRKRQPRGTRAPMGHRMRRAVTLVAMVVVGATVLTSAAMAHTAHRYVGQFGGFGSGPGDVLHPLAVATDATNGDIYVADDWNSRIQVYDATGDPTIQIKGSAAPDGSFNGLGGVAVDGTAGRVYVTEPGANAVDLFTTAGSGNGRIDASGTPQGAFNMPSGVAVDPTTGDLYVADTGNNAIDVFSSAGLYLTSFDGSATAYGAFSSPTAVAVDGSSNVYVLDAGNQRVAEFTAQGVSYVGTLSAPSPVAVAADVANDDVYVAQGSPAQVTRYDSSGALAEAFGSDHLTGPLGVAVSPTGHRAYVGDSAGWVGIFAQYTAPDVTTGGASGITDSQATLDGTVNPQGADYMGPYFEYGTDTSYGSAVFLDPPVPTGTSDVPVSLLATGLMPNMTYHYRLSASTPAGTFSGADATFTTPAIPVAVDVLPAYVPSITTSGASLHAFVNPNNSPTQYHFEYGTTAAYGSTTPDTSAGSGYGSTEVVSDLTGLAPGTTYHFRVVADNGVGGAATGADGTFTTAAAAPGSATDVTAVSATLDGDLSVSGSAWSYHFDYGTTTAYGSSTFPRLARAPGTASEMVTDLTPSTTYHVRLVVTNGTSTVVGDDGTFTTEPAPVATTGDATDASTSGATLHGTADTHGLDGTYHFLVTGVGSTVSRTTPDQPVNSDGPTDVAAAIGDLPDGGTYDVQLVVEAAGAEDRGDTTQFSTASLAPIVPRSPAPPGDPYGCVAPHLATPSLRAVAGMAYTLTGSDLGVGGTVTLGDARAQITAWTAGAITIVVPADVKGDLAVTVDCRNASNTVTLTVAAPPSNAFSVISAHARKHSVLAVVTVKVPGPGTLRVGGTFVRTATKTVSAAGTYKIGVKLNAKGVKRLHKARHRRLEATLAVRYAPTGGTAATRVSHARFTRVAARHRKHSHRG